MTNTNLRRAAAAAVRGACNLGSLNLAAFHVPPAPGESGRGSIDWERLGDTVRTCVRFLDDVVEANNYPTKEIDEMCRANRKIGLGVMGWADLLFKLDIAYDSQEALDLADEMGEFIRKEAWDEDTRLAEEKDTFKHWKGSRWDTVEHRKMRNAHCVTIAPTGTISIIAGCSGGIEPIFSLAFKPSQRKRRAGHGHVRDQPDLPEGWDAGLQQDEIDRLVDGLHLRRARSRVAGALAGACFTPSARRATSRPSGTCMQAAWQVHTDAAVSKTINFSADATPREVGAPTAGYGRAAGHRRLPRQQPRRQPMALNEKAGKKDAAGQAANGAKAARARRGRTPSWTCCWGMRMSSYSNGTAPPRAPRRPRPPRAWARAGTRPPRSSSPARRDWEAVERADTAALARCGPPAGRTSPRRFPWTGRELGVRLAGGLGLYAAGSGPGCGAARCWRRWPAARAKRRPHPDEGRTARWSRPSVTGGHTVHEHGLRQPVTINEDTEGRPSSSSTTGQGGGCAASQGEAIGRLISICAAAARRSSRSSSSSRASCHRPAWGEDGKDQLVRRLPARPSRSTTGARRARARRRARRRRTSRWASPGARRPGAAGAGPPSPLCAHRRLEQRGAQGTGRVARAGRLQRLRQPALVRGGLREVPLVRLHGVRLTGLPG